MPDFLDHIIALSESYFGVNVWYDEIPEDITSFQSDLVLFRGNTVYVLYTRLIDLHDDYIIEGYIKIVND